MKTGSRSFLFPKDLKSVMQLSDNFSYNPISRVILKPASDSQHPKDLNDLNIYNNVDKYLYP